MPSNPSFRLAFVFSINSFLPLTTFLLAEALLSAFSWLYTLVCAVVQKNHEMTFIYNYSRFWCSFCNQPALFAELDKTQTNYGRQPHRACERTKSKQK